MMKNLKERYVLFEEFPELMDEEQLESAIERAEEFFGPEELRRKFPRLYREEAEQNE